MGFIDVEVGRKSILPAYSCKVNYHPDEKEMSKWVYYTVLAKYPINSSGF